MFICSDECVSFHIQKGIDASRSKTTYFKHNDVADLERLLQEQDAIDRKNAKRAAKIRRFIIVEGIYANTGEMCPLQEIVELRRRYKLRLILDESISFGSLGKNGRGILEHLNVNVNSTHFFVVWFLPKKKNADVNQPWKTFDSFQSEDVDLICSTLENSVGSIGGFSVGTTFIVEHQILTGLGYCFSASAPPLLAQAAISALNHFEQHPEMFSELNEKCKRMNE